VNMSSHPKYIHPDGVGEPVGQYSHLSRVDGLVFVAGQVGLGPDGILAGKDLGSQARQTFANVRTILESQGGGLRDVLKFTTYVVGDEHIEPFYAVRREIFPKLYPDGQYPPNTLVVVSRLVDPDFLVEIEAIAHVAAKGAS